jgi:hypothetical protein
MKFKIEIMDNFKKKDEPAFIGILSAVGVIILLFIIWPYFKALWNWLVPLIVLCGLIIFFVTGDIKIK